MAAPSTFVKFIDEDGDEFYIRVFTIPGTERDLVVEWARAELEAQIADGEIRPNGRPRFDGASGTWDLITHRFVSSEVRTLTDVSPA